MEDPPFVSASNRNSQVSGVTGGKKGSKINLVASGPKAFSWNNHRFQRLSVQIYGVVFRLYKLFAIHHLSGFRDGLPSRVSLEGCRLSKSELHRFYTAANGDFSCLLASIKKTIRWRETYRILSEEELQTWSDMVFWHGFDVQHRPCLIVRLGLACYVLPSHDRPRFAQAVSCRLSSS